MLSKIGTYEIIERIGRGGMGTVYKARQTLMDRLVALKVISGDSDITEEMRARFFDEARTVAILNHPNIVSVYEIGEDQDNLFIAMEFLDGEGLDVLIRRQASIPIQEKISLMLQACEGLSHAHQKGVVHRDVKPSNFLVLRDGKLKIIDFGIAKMSESSARTRVGNLLGTLRYMSAEQVRSRPDQRSDQYSLGVVFFELLTGRTPYVGNDPIELLEQLRTEEAPPLRSINPSVPAELASVIERALRREPDDRYPDLVAMRQELLAVQTAIEARGAELRQRVLSASKELDESLSLLQRLSIPLPADWSFPAIRQDSAFGELEEADLQLQKIQPQLSTLLQKAKAIQVPLERAQQHFDAGRFRDAVDDFGKVLDVLPDHAAAREKRDLARSAADAAARRLRSEELLEQARSQIDSASYTEALKLLEQAEAVPAPADLSEHIAGLRRLSETALAEQKASAAARERAVDARERMALARRVAQGQDAASLVRDGWNEAVRLADEGHVHFARHQYAEALASFEASSSAFEALERDIGNQNRREAEESSRARQRCEQARSAAQAAGLTGANAEASSSADALYAEARAAEAHGAARQAVETYRKAAEIWESLTERQRSEAAALEREIESARNAAEQARASAQAAGAAKTAPALWDQAEGELEIANRALRQNDSKAGLEKLRAAITSFERSEQASRAGSDRDKRAVAEARSSASDARRAAQEADAVRHASDTWYEAETRIADGDVLLGQGRFDDAVEAFGKAVTLYRSATGKAFEAVSRGAAPEAPRPSRPSAEVSDGATRRVSVEHSPNTRPIADPPRSDGATRVVARSKGSRRGDEKPDGPRRDSAGGQRTSKGRSPASQGNSRPRSRPSSKSRETEAATTSSSNFKVVLFLVAVAIAAASLTAVRFWMTEGQGDGGSEVATNAPVAPSVTAPVAPLSPVSSKEPVQNGRTVVAPESAPPSVAPVASLQPRAEALHATAVEARKLARESGAAEVMPTEFQQAEKDFAAAEGSLDKKDFRGASGQFQQVDTAYRTLASNAAASKQAKAAQLRSIEARAKAERAGAAKGGNADYDDARQLEAKAEQALARKEYDGAASLYDQAAGRYESAPRTASTGVAETGDKSSAASAKDKADKSQDDADAAGARNAAPNGYAAATKISDKAAALFRSGQFKEAKERYDAASSAFANLSTAARLRAKAEQSKSGAEQAQAAADALNAASAAASPFRAGVAAMERADSDFRSEDFASAARRYDDATDKFQLARQQSDPDYLRSGADRARASAEAARSDAENCGAAEYASSAFGAADDSLDMAKRAYGSGSFDDATRGYQSAAKAFQDAEAACRRNRPASINEKAFVVIYTQPTDGRKGGGAFGVCWRPDASSADSCAEASCRTTRGTKDSACAKTATGAPGSYCAIGRIAGYGIAEAACAATPSAAESGARDRCRQSLTRNYPGVQASVEIVWSSSKK